ncbi:MAG: HlyD family efflux transporter periplasmic adaptor subunit [Cyanobacteria bacterium CYA]|nr:MAG: HlyD family efflux transporter periplasmic adaptor subunit [Cyanobacteria bacterium CYA]
MSKRSAYRSNWTWLKRKPAWPSATWSGLAAPWLRAPAARPNSISGWRRCVVRSESHRGFVSWLTWYPAGAPNSRPGPRLSASHSDRLRRTSAARSSQPISGVIQSVALDDGEWAQAGQVVARIVNLDRVEIPLRVPVSAGRHLRVGDPVQIRARQEDREGWSGAIARIAPEADEQTRSLTVFVEVVQEAGGARLLRPGQFVSGLVSSSTASKQVVVPRRAIVDDRILLASETENPEAAIWPVARRIAEALARGAVRSAHPSMSDPGLAESLSRSMTEATRIELGQAAETLAGAIAGPTAAWMGNSGAQTIEDQFVRVLTTHLTPQVATWLMQTPRSDLPASLQQEIEQSQRLWAVRAVPVRSLFTLEGEILEIDPEERQWVVVETVDGSALDGRILLTSNLDQLIEGALVDLSIGGEW